MSDLHGWITRQVDQREDLARRAAHYGRPDWPQPCTAVVDVGDSWPITTEAGPIAEHISENDPAAVLRRCTADRRILARHRLDPDVIWTPACHGCGTYGDQELPETDNLNDCPELLDLAHAHGITDEELATLDRPQPPERPPSQALTPGESLIAASLRHMMEQLHANADELIDGAGTGAPLGLLATATQPAREPTPVELAIGILDPHLRRCPLYQPGPPALRASTGWA